MNNKQCLRCHETKELENFPFHHNRHIGVCRPCLQERARNAYKVRKDGLLIVRYKNYRTTDRKNGFNDTISRTEATNLMKKPCHWCGENEGQIGLDRIDNNAGHEANNVVPCCEKCNQIRGDIPFEAMMILKPGLKKIRKLGLLKDWEPPYKRAYFKNRHRVRYE